MTGMSNAADTAQISSAGPTAIFANGDLQEKEEGSLANGHAPNGEITGANGSIFALKIPRNGKDLSDAASRSVTGRVNGHINGTEAKTVPAMSNDLRDQAKKLPADKLIELTSSPAAIPIHVQDGPGSPSSSNRLVQSEAEEQEKGQEQWQTVTKKGHNRKRSGSVNNPPGLHSERVARTPLAPVVAGLNSQERPPLSVRTVSTPLFKARQSSAKTERPSTNHLSEPKVSRPTLAPLDSRDARKENGRRRVSDAPMVSPMPTNIPIPPASLSSHLQLELSSSDPSPLYIYRSSMRDFPYEPSRVKLERLLNFLLLPPQLEPALWFGTWACLDAWLYNFTILPLRFMKSLFSLLSTIARNLSAEIRFLSAFIYLGLGRVWRRQHSSNQELQSKLPSKKDISAKEPKGEVPQVSKHGVTENGTSIAGKASDSTWRKSVQHRRMKSEPSRLSAADKADILKGLLIITSSVILMYFDASMMYHSIRGQAALKLYVIYNALELFDRLLAALGQDILECLFSKESLERRPDGRSKVLRPFWLFLLALVYTVVHAIELFYQVMTLNVAVNSYSNALLTLLMSNQFVEIKSTVFKRFEKENLFQITCADIVERFQLWLTLIIIASRNVIETNNIFGDGAGESGGMPTSTPSLLPSSFTLLPDWAGQIMGPFILVLGIEMLVDWVKHAYITKFNNTKPNIYGRFLDVLAKDYYTNAFTEQNLTKRLGLPVIPLTCLFIRASVQTYQMFLATHLPLPLASTTTSLEDPDPSQSPATMAEMLQLQQLLRRVLGRHVPADSPAPPVLHVSYLPFALPSADTLIAILSTGVFFALIFALLLAIKLLLGMILLAYARRRYVNMKAREASGAAGGAAIVAAGGGGTSSTINYQSHGNSAGNTTSTSVNLSSSAGGSATTTTEGRRVGGWGTVEVDEDKRRWIYDDDAEGLRKLWEREARQRETKSEKGFGGVERYSMVAKRIW